MRITSEGNENDRVQGSGFWSLGWTRFIYERVQIQDKGQWEGWFYPQGTTMTKLEQSRCSEEGIKDINTYMSNNRPLWSSSSRRSNDMAKSHLRCLWRGSWTAPGAFWLPHFLPSDCSLDCSALGSSTEGWNPVLKKSSFWVTMGWRGTEVQVEIVTDCCQRSN